MPHEGTFSFEVSRIIFSNMQVFKNIAPSILFNKVLGEVVRIVKRLSKLKN